MPSVERQFAVTAPAGISFTAHVPAGTGTCVDASGGDQVRQRRLVAGAAIALPPERRQAGVGLEPEPLQILQARVRIVGAASDAIVILEAQQHPAVRRMGESPDEYGVRD